jgi:hypothetical protein
MTGGRTDGQGVRYCPLVYTKHNPGCVQPETALLERLFHIYYFRHVGLLLQSKYLFDKLAVTLGTKRVWHHHWGDLGRALYGSMNA